MERVPPGAASQNGLPKPTPAGKAASPGARGKWTIADVLDRLDAVDDGRFRNRRSGSRSRFRCVKVPVRVTHPGGSTSERVVATRNLSSSGIGFLYDSFLHNGTRVVLRLKRTLGGEDALPGKVVYCAHVAGIYHQVGVRFDQKIFAQLYIGGERAAAAPVADSAEPPLSGALLLCDSQAMDRALVGQHLRGTQLTLHAVSDLPAAVLAVSAAQGSAFAAAIVSIEGADGAAVDAINALRKAGFAGPIVLATAETALLPKLRALKPAGVLAKPFDAIELHRVLREATSTDARASSGTEAIHHAEEAAIAAAERGKAQVDALNALCNETKL